MKLLNGDNRENNNLQFGLNTNATVGIDASLGEIEYPPCLAIFNCSSFIEISDIDEIYQYVDFKPFPATKEDSVVFNFRVFDIVNQMVFSWDKFPEKVTMAKFRSKYFSYDYDDIDMLKQSSITMTNPLNTEFKIVIKYELNSDVEENLEQQTTIYPNPISQSFYIKGIDNIMNVKIIDLMGNEVLNIKNSDNYINIENLSSGYYYLQIYTIDNKVITKNIVKI